MTEDQQETIGQIVDRLRNCIAVTKLGGMKPEFFLEQTLNVIRDVEHDLRDLIVEDGAEDWWKGREREIE